MRIRSFQTKSGEEIALGDFSVLVGANNVGKSQTLRDLHSRVREGQKSRTVIVTDQVVEFPADMDQFLQGLSVTDDARHADHKMCRGIGSNLTSGEEIRYQEEALQNQLANQAQDNAQQWLLTQFGKFRVALLDAGSRLQISASTPTHDATTQAPQRLLQALMDDENAQTKLREAFKDTFGKEVRVDYSALAHLYLRVATEFPEIPDHPTRARPIMRKFPSLDEQGDGFRSFASVLLSILLSKGRILLIDEPEAFLHPAQARRLGYWVARYAAEAASQIVVSTHNAHFLNGVLSSDTNTNIYRLNRQDDDTRFQLIDADTIENLSGSPLLSSQPVLESIFHRGVAVCEADSDRLFYQTIATKAHDEHEVQFLHAHNKQTLKDVVGLLKAASIPCAAIADIDLLNSAADLTALVESFGCAQPLDAILDARTAVATDVEGRPDEEIIANTLAAIRELAQQIEQGEHSLSGTRSALRRIDSGSTKWNEVKRDGLEALDDPIKQRARDLIASLAEIGIFVVPVGELESWIDVGTRRKRDWIVLALQVIADKGPPNSVATFIGNVIAHVRDV